MSIKAVVVWDPSGELPDGLILEGNEIPGAKDKGVVVLPIRGELLARGGVAGWAKRCYGRGWRFSSSVSSPGCPLALQVTPGYPGIYWAARVVPDQVNAPMSGLLRLAGDPTQIGAATFGLSLDDGPVQVEKVGVPDARGGLTLMGKCRSVIGNEQLFGLQLYGYLAGARVLWLAASQGA